MVNSHSQGNQPNHSLAAKAFRERQKRRLNSSISSQVRVSNQVSIERKKIVKKFFSNPIVRIVSGIIVLILIVGACIVTQGLGLLAPKPSATATPITAIPTAIAAVVSTPVPSTTVPCDTIEVSTDGGKSWTNSGEDIATEATLDLGDRTTWTSRRTVIPSKAWNVALTADELKQVEQTWLDVRANACTTDMTVFAGGFQMGSVKFNGGVLFAFRGSREFKVRNGEVVLWHDIAHRDKDLGRIVDQIKKGNFDIKGPLALAVADGLKDIKVVADFLAARPNVKIVILP